MLDESAQPPEDSASSPPERKGDTGSFKSEEVIPEWLDRIRQRASQELGNREEPDETETPQRGEEDEQLPDWLNEIKGIHASPREEDQEEEQSETSWLGDISSLTEEASDQEEPTDLPDWLELSAGQSQGGEDELESESLELPAWESTEPSEKSAADEEGTDEDWLSRLAQQSPEDQSSAFEVDQSPAAESLEWSALGVGEEEALTPLDSSESEEILDEGPVWLNPPGGAEEEPPQEPPGVAEPEAEEETPEWLTSLNAVSQEQPEEELPHEPIEAGQPAPSDWLSGLESESPEQAEEQLLSKGKVRKRPPGSPHWDFWTKNSPRKNRSVKNPNHWTKVHLADGFPFRTNGQNNLSQPKASHQPSPIGWALPAWKNRHRKKISPAKTAPLNGCLHWQEI